MDEQNKSPFLTIWTSPRATIRRIVDSDPTRFVLILAVLGGFSEALDRMSMESMGDIISIPEILLFCIIVGPIIGLIGLYVGGALLKWTGTWIGGQGSSVEIRAAIAWSNIPVICALVLWIPELLLFGEELFTSEMPNTIASPLLTALFFAFVIVEFIIGVWAFIIFLNCLGELQRFSAWKALSNTLLSVFVIVMLLFIILIPFLLFNRG
jgi:hypothetical protein